MRSLYKIWPCLILAIALPVKAEETTAEPASVLPAKADSTDQISNVPPAPSIVTVPEEPGMGLDELLTHALARNPQLPVSRNSEEAARQRLGALRSWQNPSLELIPRLAGNLNAADEEVVVSQQLDLFGRRRAQANVARAELRRAQAERSLTERGLIVAVKNAATDLFAAQEAENLGRVQVEVAELFRKAAARRAELGDVPPVQVQRADLEVLRVQNELTIAETERLSRRAILNQLIGQAPETPLRVALPLSGSASDLLRLPIGLTGGQSTGMVASSAGQVPMVAKASGESTAAVAESDGNLSSIRSQLLPGALANRPDILGAQATLEARRAQVDVIRRERLPNFELQGRRSSFFGQSGSYALRAVVTLPIFDFGSIKHDRAAAEAEAKAQEGQISLLRSQVAVQVEQALLGLQQRRATLERYRTGILPLTIDLLRKTEVGYAQGASTYLEVLEAQRTLRQVQTEYLQALVGARAQETALESAYGASPPVEAVRDIANPVGPAALPGTAPLGTVPPQTNSLDITATIAKPTLQQADQNKPGQ